MLNCGSTTNSDVFLFLLNDKFMCNMMFPREITEYNDVHKISKYKVSLRRDVSDFNVFSQF